VISSRFFNSQFSSPELNSEALLTRSDYFQGDKCSRVMTNARSASDW